jgi:glycosyltransferase involved in cell wall biosynthesis
VNKVSSGVRETEPGLVSVIMNCYNGEQYLRAAIESVLEQTYQNWEVVFWDNRSTDRSAEIFESYQDPRLRYHLASSHTVLYAARNEAIQVARGEYFAFLDVDDWWLPDKLEKQMPLFKDQSIGFVHGAYWVQDDRKKTRRKQPKNPAPTGWVLNDLLGNYFVGMLTLVIRRSALDSLDHPCDSRYHIIGDFDLVIRLAIQWKSDCVQEPIACNRMHDSNETKKHRQLQSDELESWIREMKNVAAFNSCPNASFVENHVKYRRALSDVLRGNRPAAYRIFRDLPWGRSKARLWLLLLLPTAVVQRVKE